MSFGAVLQVQRLHDANAEGAFAVTAVAIVPSKRLFSEMRIVVTVR